MKFNRSEMDNSFYHLSFDPDQAVHMEIAMTRQERINEYWDQRKLDADRLSELDRWMLYYYLNRSGLSVIGLDYKIEAALHKMFPPDPKP